MCTCSIVICTCNRAADLAPTLAAVAVAVAASRHAAEVLVVDNGSTDGTAAVVAAAAAACPAVRHIREPTSGKGFAYNRGVREARGRVLLFTDDDVRPPAGWVDAMCDPILGGEADAVAGGVAIAPHLMRPWMTAGHRGSLFHTPDMTPGTAGELELVGANMAIGRHVFDVVPGFDPELGPGGLGFKDETLVGWQLRSAGLRVAGRPGVIVEHHFNPGRLGRAAFLARQAAHGRSDAYVRYHYFHNRVRAPAARAAGLRGHLWAWRLTHPRAVAATDRFDLREGELAYRWSVAAALAVEQRRPRNYLERGLHKVAGVPVSGRPVPSAPRPPERGT